MKLVANKLFELEHGEDGCIEVFLHLDEITVTGYQIICVNG